MDMTTRQMAQRGTDLVIIPAADRYSVAVLHHRQAIYRGVENGMAMLRCSRGGISSIVDSYGNIILKGITDKEGVMYIIADVPLKDATGTIYTMLGDWVVYLSAIIIIFGIAIAVLKIRRRPF